MRRREPRITWLVGLVILYALLWTRISFAQPTPDPTPVPVWIYNVDSYEVHAGVLRTESRARTKILSSQLFINEVVAASPSMSVNTAE